MNVPAVVFVDTSYLLAVFWRRDPYHARAVAWQRAISGAHSRLVTTEAVLWELLNSLSPHRVRHHALAAYDRLRNDARAEVVTLDAAICSSAVEYYRARPDKDWGITDCLSFFVMQERGIRTALTTDHDFEQAGFDAPVLHGLPS